MIIRAMEEIIDDVVSSDLIKKFETVYNDQVEKNSVTKEATFEYACCLVRSKYAADIRKGICLLETLFNAGTNEERRDYVYYLAFGHTKLKDYTKALQYVRSFLAYEPGNVQVQNLEKSIKKRMEREGLVGIGIVGGAVLVLGGLVGLGMALASKK